ncbi:GTP-sensing pleiotropic transcriptional regulator CodY [Anaeropeptidivorans aminofermentans]|jgi:transcriptional pleiotropic repressor|uniref:GTP-sensing pleiotropic transcriptional regulator CodY n=1 Tax=Anaeropeptidivorans aminofermentans TaxID=2934315 RepID=UPI002B2209FD|nr:GTP-sensing pleiotropic transcriptional regulator CodY [Anaeropeptidivorans aminofermentans]MBE6010975.1 GTP-sensing pleiotropic transcriptional regulator CodY [Lachnospiraceae bacterium]
MLNEVRELIDRLTELIQNTDNAKEILTGIAEELSRVLRASVVLVDEAGKVIISKPRESDFSLNIRRLQDGNYIDSQLNDQIKNIVEIKSDIELSELYIKNQAKNDLKSYVGMIAPFNSASKRIGSCIVYRDSKGFTSNEALILEVGSLMATVIAGYMRNEKNSENSRKSAIVKSAIDTLSYSELEAILYIFEELNGPEGLLVASKVADRVGITRSVIVNGLRKFESAGVIESRSLGMKGTYIKVLNDKLLEEIDKLRN